MSQYKKDPKKSLKREATFEVLPPSKQKKQVYDMIHSDELHDLYQKNSQLLSQLSSTGRHNNILQSELSDLIKEKSQLDIKNSHLIDEVHSLKKKMSLFNFQYKKFNKQSLRLKRNLKEDIKNPSSLIAPSYPEKTFRNIYDNLKTKYEGQLQTLQTLEKKEIVYKNQIKNLQTYYIQFKNKEKDYKGQIKELESSPLVFKKEEERLSLKIKEKYEEEIDTLKNNYEELRHVISQQEEGFKQTLQDFRRKQLAINFTEKEKASQNSVKEVENLKLKINEIIRQNVFLKKELKKSQSPDKELEKQMQEKQLNFHKKEQQLKENYEREKQSIKNENKKYKKQLEESYDEKLKHIKSEMENDLCSEKRRVEVLKNIKEQQVSELQNQLKNLQYQVHELKASSETFKSIHKDVEKKLHDEIIKNENLKTQNKQLEHLWQSLQQNIEERNQQVRSLQKLNRDLSLALNQKNQSSSISLSEELKKPSSEPSFINEKPKKKQENLNDILAELHFD